MKKLFFIIAITLISSNLNAEAPASTESHGAVTVPQTPVTSAPASSEDKSGKLYQYISACMASRPASK